jgi:phosphohistidine phosphatase
MDLILWRHAEAIEKGEPVDDLQRPLTAKGERQADRMGKWLDRVLPSSTRVIASPAVRTQQSAKALHRRFKTVDGLAPDRGVDSLLGAAGWPGSKGPVLVVGHQPVLGLTAAYLLAGLQGDAASVWRLKKGAVWWLRSHEDEVDGQHITLVAVQSPDML